MDEAEQAFRATAAREAAPVGARVAGETGEELAKGLKQAQKEVYDEIKSFSFRPDWMDESFEPVMRRWQSSQPDSQRVSQAIQQVRHEMRQRMADAATSRGTNISGHDLISVRNELTTLGRKAAKEGNYELGQAYNKARESIDQMIYDQLATGTTRGAGAAERQVASQRWQNLRNVERDLETVASAAGRPGAETAGAFLPSDLARVGAKKGSERMEQLGRQGYEVLQAPTRESAGGVETLLGKAPYFAALGASTFGGPAAILGAAGGGAVLGRTLASRPVQRAILGQTKKQRALRKALRRGSPYLRGVARAGYLPAIPGSTRD
jgi:hypothetical protein